MRAIPVPPTIRLALEQGAALAVSISGGKDSQAMLAALARLHRAEGWSGPIFAVHAHLGRAEWKQTHAHCERICSEEGVELVVVRREKGDLVDRWRERMETLRGTGKPFWSSAASRYCTSDLKRGPINKYLRRYDHVVSAEGVRAEESRTRAAKPRWEAREAITTRTRRAYTWNPIIEWSARDVWEACGTSGPDLGGRRQLWKEGRTAEALDGWPAHPAYVMGNVRLSCALCVLASRSDLVNGAKHNPDLYQELLGMERESGFTFRQDLSLASLEKEVAA